MANGAYIKCFEARELTDLESLLNDFLITAGVANNGGLLSSSVVPFQKAGHIYYLGMIVYELVDG